ncbi:MAG: ATP-grasp domain-containing protein [Candidatus Moranbacteria bacterium]|nr:ATP-grasp domain-containing protein [Candidatus Moranbacteria bacterium]
MIRNSALIKKVVEEMGGSVEKIIPERGCFYIRIDGEKIFVSRKFKITRSSLVGKELTAFKDLTYFILEKEGIPTPKTVCFYKKTFKKNPADEKLSQLSYPIVIKDSDGSNSRGVFVNIPDISEAKRILTEKINIFPRLIAQEMVFGKEFRVLMLRNKAIGVLEMIPPSILGDGKSTVDELIARKQKDICNETVRDNVLDSILSKQGSSLGSTPEKGTRIFIKNNSCLAEGGETRDVTDIINDNIASLCAKAGKLTENYLVGIDLMCDDITKRPEGQHFSIIEINGKPDLYIHYNPTYGKTRNVIKNIIEFILVMKRKVDC